MHSPATYLPRANNQEGYQDAARLSALREPSCHSASIQRWTAHGTSHVRLADLRHESEGPHKARWRLAEELRRPALVV
eukprot:3606535-Pleurochrysis_carterae.AAC.1